MCGAKNLKTAFSTMKNPLLIPFLAILLTVFVVSFISKQEKNTNEKLFREYLRGFKQAELPLKVKANNESFNYKNKIDDRFSNFFPKGMTTRYMARRSFISTNEYLEKIAETNEIIMVLCGSSSYEDSKANNRNGSYRKIIIIYDKKGEVLSHKNIAYEAEYQDSTKALTCTINADNSFYIKNFVKRNGRKDEWILSKKEDFLITSAGKIEQKP